MLSPWTMMIGVLPGSVMQLVLRTYWGTNSGGRGCLRCETCSSALSRPRPSALAVGRWCD